MQTAYFAGGCFWCVEAVFQRVEGVLGTVSGYCNGTTNNPSYQDICTGKTGHAEVVKIEFDELKITFKQLLKIFFAMHNSTTLNQQGNDKGTQYRSAVFHVTGEQQFQVVDMINHMSDNVVTKVTQLDIFYPAEEYHQNYYNNNKNQAYCQLTITPKIDKYFYE